MRRLASRVIDELLSEDVLERSAVVANLRMNRQRVLEGGNGYGRELGFSPVDYLRDRLAQQARASWLDLCCGEGWALVKAVEALRDDGLDDRVDLVGVDLVGPFAGTAPRLSWFESPLRSFAPGRRFDLITCVHGLHYVGDKLELVARAMGWLAAGGRFVATLDLGNLRREGGATFGRPDVSALRSVGLSYNGRRHLLSGTHAAGVRFPFDFIGADPGAGPNFSGQPAVDSYYRPHPLTGAGRRAAEPGDR